MKRCVTESKDVDLRFGCEPIKYIHGRTNRQANLNGHRFRMISLTGLYHIPLPARHRIPLPHAPLFLDSVVPSSRQVRPLDAAAHSMLLGNFVGLKESDETSLRSRLLRGLLLWRLFMLPISVCRIIWLRSWSAFSYEAERSCITSIGVRV